MGGSVDFGAANGCDGDGSTTIDPPSFSLCSELEEDVVSLSQLGPEEAVRGVVVCLRAVTPGHHTTTTHHLPQNMAHRFRAAAAIAQQVKVRGEGGAGG